MEVCLPAKLYFICLLCILIFSFSTGKFRSFLNHKYKKLSTYKRKKMIHNWIGFVFLFSLIFLGLITWIMNQFCSMGYEIEIGIVVLVLLTLRFAKLFQKGY